MRQGRLLVQSARRHLWFVTFDDTSDEEPHDGLATLVK